VLPYRNRRGRGREYGGSSHGNGKEKMECFFSGDGMRGRREKEEAAI